MDQKYDLMDEPILNVGGRASYSRYCGVGLGTKRVSTARLVIPWGFDRMDGIGLDSITAHKHRSKKPRTGSCQNWVRPAGVARISISLLTGVHRIETRR